MALTLTSANRILEKLDFPAIRHAHGVEAQTNEYGEKVQWVIDRGTRQALQGYHTLNDAIGGILEQNWDAFDGAKLTEIERRGLRAIPSNVARLI